MPVMVTGTAWPGVPMAGLMPVMDGALGPEPTLNGSGLLLPAGVVIVTMSAPGVAFAAIVNTAVIWVLLTTTKFPWVTPGPFTHTAAPVTKFVPVMVTGTTCPSAPPLGETLVIVGSPFAGVVPLTVTVALAVLVVSAALVAVMVAV